MVQQDNRVQAGRRIHLRWWDWLLVIALAVTFGLIVLFVSNASSIVDRLSSTPTKAITIFPESATSTDEAAEEANRAIETVNLMLDFIQAGAIVLAAVAVVVTGLGVWNNARLQEELQNTRDLRDAFEEVAQIAEMTSQQSAVTRQAVEAKLAQVDQRIAELDEHLQTTTSIRDQLIPGINLTLLAQRQISMGNLPEAMETLKLAYQTHPDNALIRYLLGDTMVRQGDLYGGIQHLAAARGGLPNFYDADVAYAYARRLQGDQFTDDTVEREIHYAAAKQIFLQVAKERPYLQDISGESAFGALAGLYRREGNITEAIRWYKNAQQATPQNTYPINNLALCYLAIDDRDEARRYFTLCRDMSRARFTLLPTDYYSRFDHVTACLGLAQLRVEPYPAEVMTEDLRQIFELIEAIGLSAKPLHSFRHGLDRLNPAVFPAAAAAIQQVEAQISTMA